MTNEEIIEEILYKAHEKGIRQQVLETSVKLMDVNKSIPFLTALEQAYRIEKKKI